MAKPSRPKPTPEQRKLEQAQIERMKELRVDKAREEAKVFEDRKQFRNRMRGFRSLISGGYEGYPK